MIFIIRNINCRLFFIYVKKMCYIMNYGIEDFVDYIEKIQKQKTHNILGYAF